jgi:chloramphenicol-sensitive protein RarD
MESILNKESKQGVLYTSTTYCIWGILPVYWKLLSFATPFEILASRFIYSVIFVAIIILISGKTKLFLSECIFIFTNFKRTLCLIAASLTIGINSGAYIWAVNSGQILASSLGYYINPLISVMIGVVYLKEKLNIWQAIAFALSAIAVMNMLWQLGEFPWVALVLAITFAIYGLIKKFLKVSVLTSILLEALLLSPIMLAYEYYLGLNQISAYQNENMAHILILISAGAATAIPLMLFSAGAKRLPLKVMGFLQYLSPTLSMLIGIFIYSESFTNTLAVSFGLIWAGLLIFSVPQITKKHD